ncbi:hypothetical protein M8J77_005838 [Diaphorina citri]|nr:hypothetical protein M8J77_005838 [Diaphorina citri]
MSFGDMKLSPREKHNHAPIPTSTNSPRSPIPTVPKDTDSSVPVSQCFLSSISPASRPCIQTPKQLSDDNQGNRAPPTPATHTPLSAFLSDVAKTIDWDKTPVTTSTIIELKSQVRALAQEIIKKEVIIESLRKKSESDEVLIRDLTASIQSLEDRERADKETNTDTLSNVDSAVQTETGSSSAVLNPVSLPLSAPSSSNVRAKPSRRRRKRKSVVKAPLPTQQPQHFSQRDGEHTRRIVIVSDSMGRGLASILTAMLPSADVTGYVYPNAGFNDVIQRAADVSTDLSRDDFLLVLAGTNNTSVLSPSTCPLRDNVLYDTTSSVLPIRAGVPQGSVLGPILFLLYINDLVQCDTSAKFVIFADDTSILIGGKDRGDVVGKARDTLSTVASWFSNNKLTLNGDKTSFMYFKSQSIEAQSRISTPTLTIHPVNELKFLGLYLDVGLRWKAHITYIKPKLASAIYAIRSIQRNVGSSAALQSYHAYFHSLMSYGVVYWGFAAGNIDVFLLQKRAVRAIFNLHRTVSCRTIFKENKILTFAAQVILDTCTLIHKKSAILTRHSDRHQYSTRHKNNLVISKNTLMNSSFLTKGIQLYNNLHDSLKNENLDNFRTQLKNELINTVPYTIEEFES